MRAVGARGMVWDLDVEAGWRPLEIRVFAQRFELLPGLHDLRGAGTQKRHLLSAGQSVR